MFYDMHETDRSYLSLTDDVKAKWWKN